MPSGTSLLRTFSCSYHLMRGDHLGPRGSNGKQGYSKRSDDSEEEEEDLEAKPKPRLYT